MIKMFAYFVFSAVCSPAIELVKLFAVIRLHPLTNEIATAMPPVMLTTGSIQAIDAGSEIAWMLPVVSMTGGIAVTRFQSKNGLMTRGATSLIRLPA